MKAAIPRIRVGCDAQSISDVRAGLERYGERYLRRLLSEAESGPTPSMGEAELVRYVAGRFAAKEAVFKLLRADGGVAVAWSQIEVIAERSGAPRVRLAGAMAQLAVEAGLGEIDVSISHADGFAFAVAAAGMVREAGDEPADA